jgi:plasmid stabilization system protein ParE
MELVILARAEVEVIETQARLEDTNAGLGDRFNERVEQAFDLLAEFPELGPVYAGQFRRLLVRDFPFGIFYSVEGRRTVVQAVLDLRQEPLAIRRRLGLGSS